MKKAKVLLGLTAIIVTFITCTKNTQVLTATTTALANLKPLSLTISTPIDNPQTDQKIALGKALFWDPILSGNKDVACASCHHASLGFTDGLDLPIGVNGAGLGITRHFVTPNSIPFSKRNAISIINVAFNGITADSMCDPVTAGMFFDLRVKSLELQSVEPIKAMEEMRGASINALNILDTVILRLKSIPQYVQLFTSVFATTNAVTTQNMAKAIAAYERSIVSNNSAYDKYTRGDQSALSAIQVQGMTAFANNGCIKCHSGPMFSDYSLHILSVPDNPKLPTDAGANGTYAFRTASLRNLSLTAPYMHSGVFTSLNSVLDFYDQVGNRRSQNANVRNNQLDANLQHVNNNDKNAIIQFLAALTDTGFDKSIPSTVPSGLHPGGNITQ